MSLADKMDILEVIARTHQGGHDPTPRPALPRVHHDRWHKTQGG